MSAEQDKLEASVNRLRRQLAEADARAGDLRARLAAAEAKMTGSPPPPTGLELLWKAALPKSRERSSKHRCRVAWNRIPKNERPTLQTMLDSLKIWNRSDGWKSEGNTYAPGLHRFISERLWEDLPESAAPPSRYRATPTQAAPMTTPEDLAALAEFLTKKPPSKSP
jgi:hypothetical protein